ncbi:MAG TPA: ATP-binding protein, partial [Rhodothermales bacterium]
LSAQADLRTLVENALELLHDLDGYAEPSSWQDSMGMIRRALDGYGRKASFNFEHDDCSEAALPVSKHSYALMVCTAIDNSLEAAPKERTLKISVTTRTTRIKGRLHAITEVADDGPGVDPSLKGSVFDPGTTTKGPGRGHGLYLLRLLVEDVGGKVDFDSLPGTGSHVRIVLPLSTPGGYRRTPAQPAKSVRFVRPLRVLLVDDDRAYLHQLARLFGDAACEVASFDSGHDAIAWINAQASLPDIAVIDLVLQDGLSGDSVADVLRARQPHFPIVFHSGYRYSTDVSPNDVFVLKLNETGYILQEMSRLTSVSLEEVQ